MQCVWPRLCYFLATKVVFTYLSNLSYKQSLLINLPSQQHIHFNKKKLFSGEEWKLGILNFIVNSILLEDILKCLDFSSNFRFSGLGCRQLWHHFCSFWIIKLAHENVPPRLLPTIGLGAADKWMMVIILG